MKDNTDDDKYRVPLGELAPIVSAAVFGVVFFIICFWLAFGSFDSLIPRGQAVQAPSGEVTVTLPDKPKQ